MALLVARRVTTLVAAAGAALVLAATPALAVVTASTDGFDTVTIESDEAADVVTMTCDADEANVNGTSALPALACDDVATVLVDAEDGANTVNLGGLTLLAFPLLARTSIDAADSDADSITGSEARDEVHADFLDDASTGLGNDWVEVLAASAGARATTRCARSPVRCRVAPATT